MYSKHTPSAILLSVPRMLRALISAWWTKPPRDLARRSRMALRQWCASQQQAQKNPLFFVLSTGRTGTKTLKHILNLSPHAHVEHEPKPALWPLGKLAYSFPGRCLDGLSTCFWEYRRQAIAEAISCGLGYGETGNDVTFLAYSIHRALPSAKFVHLVRHPRGIVRSGLRRGWYTNAPGDRRRIRPLPHDPACSSWVHWSRPQKIAWLWAETNRYITAFCSQAGASATFLLHSEALFRGDMQALGQLFDFLDLPMPPARRVHRVLETKYNRTADACAIEPMDPRQLLRIASEQMAACGYTDSLAGT